MIPFCLDQGVGGIPWSPLARGKLTPKEGSIRINNDAGLKRYYIYISLPSHLIHTQQ